MKKTSLFLILLLLIKISFAQDITGDIEGRISDSLGSPIPGVNIFLQSENLQGLRGTSTNDEGYFRIYALPIGSYTVKISFIGYQNITFENVQISLGKTTNLGQIQLHQQAYNLTEVVVSGEKFNIDPTSTTYGGNLNAKDFENLPVDRNYRSMISLLPQANTSYYGDEVNIGGATGFENKYFVDGVEVTDPLFARDGMNLPYNFIQEVELKIGGYEAEYRSSLGGNINVITYSGTNNLQGSFFGFYTGNNFSRNSRLGLLDPSQGDFDKYDIGFNLRGPILIDKLWFNLAYNPTFDNLDVEVPGFGIHVNRSVIHSFASKLTWNALQQLQIILTAAGDPTTVDGVGRWVLVPPDSMTSPDRYYEDFTEGMYSFSLKGNYTVNPNFLLNASAARVNEHDEGYPATDFGNNPTYTDYTTNTWSGGIGGWYNSFRYSNIFNISGTYSFSSHILSAGIDYKVNGTDNRYFYDNIDKYDDTTFAEYKGTGYQIYQQRIPSVYIQDNWQIFRWLRLNAGVRWDGQYIFSSNNKLAQKIQIPLQPRLGVIFSPSEDGSYKFFASYGRYSQELNLGTGGIFSDQGYDSTFFYHQDPRISRVNLSIAPWSSKHTIHPEIEGLRGQYYDEFSFGYERLLGQNFRIGVQGVYRILREAIDDVFVLSEERYRTGNPGRGIFSEWPRPQRDYTALIITIERHLAERFNFLASYVLSRDYGNYEGLFDAFNHGAFPNANVTFDDLSTSRKNATGLVSNDHTHVFKFSGSYRFSFGLITGISFTAQSGTPLSEFAWTGYGLKFLSPRGSVGRTPAIWDLNARLMYELPLLSSWQTKIMLDIFHIASQQKPVDINQFHYFSFDENGNPFDVNSNYGKPYRYQQPMSMRLGMEVNF